MDIPLDRVRKTFQVTVNARRTVRMVYVQGLAESGRTDGDADDRAVGDRTDRLVDHALSLDVDARMEMVAAQLPVIGRQQHRESDRRNESELSGHRRMRRILGRRRSGATNRRRQYNPFFHFTSCKNHFHHFHIINRPDPRSGFPLPLFVKAFRREQYQTPSYPV